KESCGALPFAGFSLGSCERTSSTKLPATNPDRKTAARVIRLRMGQLCCEDLGLHELRRGCTVCAKCCRRLEAAVGTVCPTALDRTWREWLWPDLWQLAKKLPLDDGQLRSFGALIS